MSAAQVVVSREYQGINKKLKSGLYNTFSEFEHDIKTFYVFLMEENRKFQSCEMVYMEFINKRILEASQFFLKAMEQEVGTLRETKADAASKGDKEIFDLKTELSRVRTDAEESISRLEREKVEWQFKNEQSQRHGKEKQTATDELSSQQAGKISFLAAEVESLTKELREKETALENSLRDGQREHCLRTAEWEKSKALHLQQEKFLQEKIESF